MGSLIALTEAWVAALQRENEQFERILELLNHDEIIFMYEHKPAYFFFSKDKTFH